jgi:hypothetical protein
VSQRRTRQVSEDLLVYLYISRALRARALRALVFLGSLPLKTERAYLGMSEIRTRAACVISSLSPGKAPRENMRLPPGIELGSPAWR